MIESPTRVFVVISFDLRPPRNVTRRTRRTRAVDRNCFVTRAPTAGPHTTTTNGNKSGFRSNRNGAWPPNEIEIHFTRRPPRTLLRFLRFVREVMTQTIESKWSASSSRSWSLLRRAIRSARGDEKSYPVSGRSEIRIGRTVRAVTPTRFTF